MPKLGSYSYQPQNITIPTLTLVTALGDLDVLDAMLGRTQLRMVGALLSTVFVGIYTVCAVYAAKILIRRGLKDNGRKLLFVVAAMYTATFIYWISLVVSQFQTLRAVIDHRSYLTAWLGNIAENLIPASSCFPASSGEDQPSGYCTSAQTPGDSLLKQGWSITQADCVGTAALTFNITIGDAIVWWRVWVLWNKNRLVLVTTCIVLLATLACGLTDSVYTCNNNGLEYWNVYIGSTNLNFSQSGSFFGGNAFGLSAILLSLCSNTLATSLVGYKTWRHRLRTKTYFSRVQSVSRVQRVMMLLVESGIAYCVLWVLVFSANDFVKKDNSFVAGWSIYMLYFTEGCLVALIGIYPTLIIVLVALDKSEIEKRTVEWSLPAVHTVPLSPVRRQVATDVFSAADTGVDASTRSHSVIFIGPSTRLSEVTSEDGLEHAKFKS